MKNPEDYHPLEDVTIELSLAISSGDALAEGERHRDSDDEKEQGHDQVFKTEPHPFCMVQLCADEPGCRGIEDFVQAAENPLPADDPKHYKTTQRIDRGQSAARGHGVTVHNGVFT